MLPWHRNRSALPSLADFDAILFHGRDMDKPVIQVFVVLPALKYQKDPPRIPIRIISMRSSKVPNQKRRRREQLYVFFILESPLNDGLNYSNPRFIINHCISSTCRFKSFFNLTMTYRRDSDLVRPYGWISPLQTPPNSLQQPTEFQRSENLKRNPPTPEVSWLTPTSPSQELQRALGRLKKPKLVAWIASNCDTHSDREDFVEQLKKHIKVVFLQPSPFSLVFKVDVFGKCGRKKCGPANGGASNLECDAMIEENYKFFLAFENSICTDYVTEKFFRTLSRYIRTHYKYIWMLSRYIWTLSRCIWTFFYLTPKLLKHWLDRNSKLNFLKGWLCR